jgi:ribonuclease E
MSKRMLIDSSHPEETRVVVLAGQKVEEFDFEAASKRPLKGNIYLAKVTRVEPSLQAAFVEYGGNRQGFLAFSEIHPDYYQIPVADRMALIAEAEAEARRRSEDDVESFEITSGPKPKTDDEEEDESLTEDGAEGTGEDPAEVLAEAVEEERAEHDGEDEVFSNHSASDSALDDEHDDRGHENGHDHAHDQADDEVAAFAAVPSDEAPAFGRDEFEPTDTAAGDLAEEEEKEGIADEQTVASAAAEHASTTESEIPSADPDVTENVADMQTASEDLAAAQDGEQPQQLRSQRPPQRWMRRRHYKIQEVIKRRQIILVQVVKEERGNKGAALTTYLSLAGRYCVLMPNTPRGGGISRKITNANDRKRLKSAAQALELPEGMGLIIRTAGENRTKVEIRRDYEYLLRLWDTIRELTLQSNAPACVYEEGDLIKRAIRDLYNKDVIDVTVEGEDGYKNAKDFMRMLMPSHAKNVKLYKEPVPLYQRHHIEAQLDAMFSPTVTLKSGGYIVINQTEALVSIDVNSGRATREHSIEETAHKTNLEAADEIGRQLRLRDLAGLIVIDFIDMEDGRNDRDVEKRLRDAVKNDRARVQIGKISQFGLMEMSRQRLRAGVIAGSTVPCPHCGGQGIVRSVESTALRVLRGLEEEGQKLKASAVIVRVAGDVAMYTLNQKRKELSRIENDYGMEINFEAKDSLPAGTFEIDRTIQKTQEERERYAVSIEAGFAQAAAAAAAEAEAEADLVEEVEEIEDEVEEEIEAEEAIEDVQMLGEAEPREGREQQHPQERGGQGEDGGRRRRRRRGGRNRNRGGDRNRDRNGPREQQQGGYQQNGQHQHAESSEQAGSGGEQTDAAGISDSSMQAQQQMPGQQGDGMQRRRRRRRRGRRGQGNGEQRDSAGGQGEQNASNNGAGWNDRFGDVHDEIDTTPRDEPVSQPVVPNASSTPEWSLTSQPARMSEEVSPARTETPAESAPAESGEPKPAKRGWWQRAFRSE